MKVLGINGSHRKESSTEFFLKKALKICENEGHQTEMISLHDKEIKHCTVCNLCSTKFACPQKDDMWPLIDKMAAADAIIIATPTYFASVSGKLKNFFDRSLPLRRNGMKLKNKVGGAIASGASRNGGQEIACQQIISWMHLQEMVTVVDAGTAHFGGIAWVPRGSMPEDDKIGIETSESLGRKIAEVLNLLNR